MKINIYAQHCSLWHIQHVRSLSDMREVSLIQEGELMSIINFKKRENRKLSKYISFQKKCEKYTKFPVKQKPRHYRCIVISYLVNTYIKTILSDCANIIINNKKMIE